MLSHVRFARKIRTQDGVDCRLATVDEVPALRA